MNNYYNWHQFEEEEKGNCQVPGHEACDEVMDGNFEEDDRL